VKKHPDCVMKGSLSTAIAINAEHANNMIENDLLGCFTKMDRGMFIEQRIDGVECNFSTYIRSDGTLVDPFIIGRELKWAQDNNVGNLMTGEVASMMYTIRRNKLPKSIQAAYDMVEKILRPRGSY
jgi:phosphoribosylamine-glycine ligase